MSQNTNNDATIPATVDHSIANASGANFRADTNYILQDIQTCHSGTSAPTATDFAAGSLWFDTTSGTSGLLAHNGSSFANVIWTEKISITQATGAISANADNDVDFVFGRCKIGSSIGADVVYLSHYDKFSTANASLIITAGGKTTLNGVSTLEPAIEFAFGGTAFATGQNTDATNPKFKFGTNSDNSDTWNGADAVRIGVAVADGAASRLLITGTSSGGLLIEDTGGGSNQKLVAMSYDGGVLKIQPLSDIGGVGTHPVTIEHDVTTGYTYVESAQLVLRNLPTSSAAATSGCIYVNASNEIRYKP